MYESQRDKWDKIEVFIYQMLLEKYGYDTDKADKELEKKREFFLNKEY